MGDYILEIDKETETVLVGEITERSQFYINVKLISPFYGFESCQYLSGHAKQTQRHFLTDEGEKRATVLLFESYRMMKEIDSHLDYFTEVYFKLQLEIEELDCCRNGKIKNRIKVRLYDWFYNCFLAKRFSGLFATNKDKEQIDQIFRIYKLTGKKIYMPLN